MGQVVAPAPSLIGTARDRWRQVDRRLGLRARVTAAFALGALVLSAAFAALAYGLVRENLVRQRENAAVERVYANALQLSEDLRTRNRGEDEAIEKLQVSAEASPVLYHEGGWFAGNGSRSKADLPSALRKEVETGPARMRFDLDGQTHLGVGTPILALDGAYFEIVALAEVEETLSDLALSLLSAALLTTLAGAALGAIVSRRVLRPLRHVGEAATAIAGGRLDTRVAMVDDADLGTVITSFNDMARALQDRVERDTRFASDVSHELRSPLTTVTASIQVLQSRRDDMPERARAALDLLAADVERFTAMVSDLLEISRFDAGAASLALEDVRITDLVRHAVAASSGADVPVMAQAGAGDHIVAVDKRRLVRVIANLIDNAARHGEGATEVSVEVVGPNVRIAVEDNGPGVPDEDRSRIFERFSRGTGTAGRRSSSEGVGLGLSLVQGHIGLHHGQVWVEGRRDGRSGARFVIELPIVISALHLEAEVEVDLGPAAVPAAEVEV